MFKQILEKIFCCHDWESIEMVRKFETSESKMPCKIIHIYCCKKCGKMKRMSIE